MDSSDNKFILFYFLGLNIFWILSKLKGKGSVALCQIQYLE